MIRLGYLIIDLFQLCVKILDLLFSNPFRHKIPIYHVMKSVRVKSGPLLW